MSLRTFTVFQDAPSSDAPKTKTTSTSNATVLLTTTNSINPTRTIITTAEKENVHPVTGERAGPNNAKKRKTSVLATKVHITLESKKQKDLKEAQPNAKKRKSSSSTLAVKGKGISRKDGKSRKPKKAPSRKVSPMPKLEEEVDTDRERNRVAQADIDSRCYELTVKPLADVSQAYEQSASFEISPPCTENIKFRPVKVRLFALCSPDMRNAHSTPRFIHTGIICRTGDPRLLFASPRLLATSRIYQPTLLAFSLFHT